MKERPGAVVIGFDHEVAAVDQAVVGTTQGHEVVRLMAAAERSGAHVVLVQEAVVSAAGDPASLVVASQDGPSGRGRNDLRGSHWRGLGLRCGGGPRPRAGARLLFWSQRREILGAAIDHFGHGFIDFEGLTARVDARAAARVAPIDGDLIRRSPRGLATTLAFAGCAAGVGQELPRHLEDERAVVDVAATELLADLRLYV